MPPQEPVPLRAGLYLVATPIGSARDITLRALDILRVADVIAAEDTRNARKLMEIHGVPLAGRPVIAYHDHNGAVQRPRILRMIGEGKSVAYVSDAGTPLVADPGFALARDAIAEDLPVHGAPGASAVLAALVVAGLPTDRFLFAGFPPPAKSARETWLRELKDVPATLVFFESPRRLSSNLKSCVTVLGGEREAAICRELTKKFEEVRRGTLAELADLYDDKPPKGEIVVVIDRSRMVAGPGARDAMLEEAMKTMTVKDAASHVAKALNLPRRDVYQAALDLAGRR